MRFFFKAEDGIRNLTVTGFQTCALPIWMRPLRKRVEWLFRPGHNQLRHEPLGVIGIMAPWNYPLLLTLGPLCDALAAGNRALLKPSELTPAFSEIGRASCRERV